MSGDYGYCEEEHEPTGWVCSLEPGHGGQHEGWDSMEVGVNEGAPTYTALTDGGPSDWDTNPVRWGDAGVPAPLHPAPVFDSVEDAECWLALVEAL